MCSGENKEHARCAQGTSDGNDRELHRNQELNGSYLESIAEKAFLKREYLS